MTVILDLRLLSSWCKCFFVAFVPDHNKCFLTTRTPVRPFCGSVDTLYKHIIIVSVIIIIIITITTINTITNIHTNITTNITTITIRPEILSEDLRSNNDNNNNNNLTRKSLEQDFPFKVHITTLTKFRSETPYDVKTLHAKYFQNQNCGFPII